MQTQLLKCAENVGKQKLSLQMFGTTMMRFVPLVRKGNGGKNNNGQRNKTKNEIGKHKIHPQKQRFENSYKTCNSCTIYDPRDCCHRQSEQPITTKMKYKFYIRTKRMKLAYK